MTIKKFISERSMTLAVLYMTFLSAAFAVFWWILLVGSQPFTVRSVLTVDATGAVHSRFSPGDLVGVRRVLCSTTEADVQFRMSIRSDLGLVVPLFGVVARVAPGCHQYGYGFIMPPLPPGTYNIHSTVIYQTNLVGRDEFSEFDPVSIEVKP